MLVACVITTMVSLVLAAGSDLRCRLIPNHLPLAIAASFGIAALAEPSAMTVLAAIAVAGGIFVTGLLLFALNILGGGDVKLLAATALWAGVDQIALLLMATAVVGGLLGLLVWLHCITGRWRLLSRSAEFAAQPSSVPYGVAIAIGGAAVLVTRF